MRTYSFRRRALLIAMAVCLGFACAVAGLEFVFRTFPRLIPAGYRQTLPVIGTELITPGLLGRTPIDGVPLPYGFDHQREMTGTAPSDLESLGMVAPHDNPDGKRYPSLSYRTDRFGFLNPREINRADLVLLGDSFVVAAGIFEPPGLQRMLAESSGLEIFNLAVPAIGTTREAWLLKQIGLGLKPSMVIWFFFGGNDLDDVAGVEGHRRMGVESYADLFLGQTMPRSIALSFFGHTIRSVTGDEPQTDALPGIRFAKGECEESVWFYPAHLRRLARTRKHLVEHSGWSATTAALREVSTVLKQRQVRLLVVYVPSKAQALLPHVEHDAGLIHRMATFDRPIQAEPDAFLQAILFRRGELEALLGEFCDENGIPFQSLTPYLDRFAADGILGYLSADTHWNYAGQRAALPALRSWIQDQQNP
jgi:hypothetical protein